MCRKYGFIIYVGLVAISILAYLSLAAYSYVIKQCQNKYGLSYNEKRKDLGIPTIPANWSIKERNENFIGWSGNETRVGHKRKSVTFSGCSIEGELDVFKLSTKNGEERLLEIKNYYPNESKSAAVFYTYQIGHYGSSISKMTADSILNAEHISATY